VTGSTVKIDKSKELENLYKIARRAMKDGNYEQACKKYEQLQNRDPDNWEPVFYAAFYSGLLRLKNDNPGSSVRISGNQVSLSNNYRDGLDPCIRSIHNCLDSVFALIGDMKDYDEQRMAIKAVHDDVTSISSTLMQIIDNEYERMVREILHYFQETGTSSGKVGKRNNAVRAAYEEDVASMLASLNRNEDHLEEVVAKRRFDEFWDANQPLKAQLLSERESLEGQVVTFNGEITGIPERTEGYGEMIRLQKEVERLAAEKKALGFFKFKDKKAIKLQINSTNDAIKPIQSRIDSAIAAVNNRIKPLQSRIRVINTELTKPR
jgi:tetratricopeptide (TPR) repeat protein